MSDTINQSFNATIKNIITENSHWNNVNIFQEWLAKVLYPLSTYNIIIPRKEEIWNITKILYDIKQSSTLHYLQTTYTDLECNKTFKDNPWEEKYEKEHAESIRDRYNTNKDMIHTMIAQELGIFVTQQEKEEQIDNISKTIETYQTETRSQLSQEIEWWVTESHVITTSESKELEQLLQYIEKIPYIDDILQKKIDHMVLSYITNDWQRRDSEPNEELYNNYQKNILIPLLEQLLITQHWETYAIINSKTHTSIIQAIQNEKPSQLTLEFPEK